MDRAQRITREIKRYDRKLYCDRNKEGTLCIYREIPKYDVYTMDGGSTLVDVRSTPSFVMALTDTWSTQGRPVDWGLLPICNRIKALDIWRNDQILEDMIKDYEKADAAKERDQDNRMESFLYDFRDQFKKTFNDYNVASLDKKDLRRIKEK